jgi:hypothetical protein
MTFVKKKKLDSHSTLCSLLAFTHVHLHHLPRYVPQQPIPIPRLVPEPVTDRSILAECVGGQGIGFMAQCVESHPWCGGCVVDAAGYRRSSTGECPGPNTRYVVYWDVDRRRCPEPLVMLVAVRDIPRGGIITRPATADGAEHITVL